MLSTLIKKCDKYINDDIFVFCVYIVDPNDQCCFDCTKYQKSIKELKITNHEWLVIMKKPKNVQTNDNNKNSTYFEADRLKVIDILNVQDPSISIDFLVVPPRDIDPDSELGKLSISSITHTCYIKNKITYRYGRFNHQYLVKLNNEHRAVTQPIGVPYFKTIEQSFNDK
jgi:hypothetical protein